jgi:hypothetical protein
MNPEIHGYVVEIPIVIPDWLIALAAVLVILTLIALIVWGIARRKQ